MKRIKSIYLMLFLGAMIAFTSCSKEEDAQRVTVETLTNDLVFEEAIKSSFNLVVTAQENNWQANSVAINSLMDRVNAGDVSADAELTSILGMTRVEFVALVEGFAVSVNDLNTKYPELEDMSDAEKNALFSAAISNNESIVGYVNEVQSALRGCALQDLCNGIVNLAALIGGPILCDIIAGAVPVIGPLLCNIVVDLAKDLLFGICNALPC
jgi:hypothetical protein